PRYALALHHTVGEQPHGAARKVGPHVPLRRPRYGVRQAPATGAVARSLSGRRGGVEANVLRFRRHRRARRPAVDAGGRHRGDDLSVEPRIACRYGPVADVEVAPDGRPFDARRCCHDADTATAAPGALAEIGHGDRDADGPGAEITGMLRRLGWRESDPRHRW